MRIPNRSTKTAILFVSHKCFLYSRLADRSPLDHDMSASLPISITGRSVQRHIRHTTEAFGPANSRDCNPQDDPEFILHRVPDPPEKEYLVIIKGPKPGIYYDFRYASLICYRNYISLLGHRYKIARLLTDLYTIHSMTYIAKDSVDACEAFAKAMHSGLIKETRDARRF
jgi:hypothetical protein